ncbi:hypothetical protein B0H17DRAFT_1064226 [Mycena rosella]|uniref:Uncharacterized protein n=1 Tax=Mycena rosella TaxID=1033263 RepID=A0AAD7DGA9_MYCRO|nr:hypothetical protein B0H17DRAFT_1064226 [Mycena rosella]
MRDELLQFFVRRYGAVKSQFPGEGRRKWNLRVLQEFWASSGPEGDVAGAPTALADEILNDDDPFDEILGDGPQLGLLLRTDFSNEDAWQAFCARLKSEEQDLIESVQPSAAAAPTEATAAQASSSTGDVKMADDEGDDDSDDESADGGLSAPVVKIINPASDQERAVLQNISNITALRLMNDVDIRPAPSPPAGTKRISPPNRLVDKKGWQEIYTGLTLWIYDTQSNTDQCARLVNQQGDVYGTATGDSWRARVTHVCELQFNMTYLGMKIDFGGLDRYDYPERKRNLEEAER